VTLIVIITEVFLSDDCEDQGHCKYSQVQVPSQRNKHLSFSANARFGASSGIDDLRVAKLHIASELEYELQWRFKPDILSKFYHATAFTYHYQITNLRQCTYELDSIKCI
jgi:ribosome-binding factor A